MMPHVYNPLGLPLIRVMDNKQQILSDANCRRVFIFIGEFIFSIGELLVFIGENLQFTWVSFQMGI